MSNLSDEELAKAILADNGSQCAPTARGFSFKVPFCREVEVYLDEPTGDDLQPREESTAKNGMVSQKGLVQNMRAAYNTYTTLAKFRRNATENGLAVAAVPLLQWALGDRSQCAQWSFKSLAMLFICGAALGFAAHSELRWHLHDCKEHAAAKSRALQAALEFSENADKEDLCEPHSGSTSDVGDFEDSSEHSESSASGESEKGLCNTDEEDVDRKPKHVDKEQQEFVDASEEILAITASISAAQSTSSSLASCEEQSD